MGSVVVLYISLGGDGGVSSDSGVSSDASTAGVESSGVVETSVCSAAGASVFSVVLVRAEWQRLGGMQS